MSIKKWHDNIPKDGVLCKEISSGSIVRIMGKSNLLNGMVMDDCVSRNHFNPDELTPLTAAEIWGFMPWQDMKDAPINGKILIDIGIKCVIGLQYKKGIFITIDGMMIDTPKKWLPLPQVSK